MQPTPNISSHCSATLSHQQSSSVFCHRHYHYRLLGGFVDDDALDGDGTLVGDDADLIGAALVDGAHEGEPMAPPVELQPNIRYPVFRA